MRLKAVARQSGKVRCTMFQFHMRELSTEL